MDIIARIPRDLRGAENQRRNAARGQPNPADPSVIDEIREPIVQCFIMVPNEYLAAHAAHPWTSAASIDHTESSTPSGSCSPARFRSTNPGRFQRQNQIDHPRYGSMDYEHSGHRADKLVKLDILVNGEPVDAFSSIVHRDKAEFRTRPRSQAQGSDPHAAYQVSIQPPSAGKSSRARTSPRCARNSPRNATAATSPATQAPREAEEGKKRMKSIGKVNIPQEAFIKV